MRTFHAISGYPKSNDSGFTLIEIIAVLIIAGIAATMAGMGFVHSMDTLMASREAATMVQETDFVMKRLSRELQNCWSITTVGNTPNFFTFKAEPETGGFLYTPDITLAEYRKYTYDTAYGIKKFADMSISGGSSSDPNKSIITVMGDYGDSDQLVSAFGYDGSDWASGAKIEDQAGFSLLLILENPLDSDKSYRIETTVALRNNRVPNMPVPY